MRRENQGGQIYKVFVASLVGAIIGAVAVGMFLVNFVAPEDYKQNKANFVSNETDVTGTINAGNTPIYSYDVDSEPIVSVVETAGPSVVKVATKQSELVTTFFGFGNSLQETEGTGSGVIIDSRGYILTNNHVIEKSTEISVILTDGRSYEAKVVGTDAYTDLAVLKIDADNLTVASLGNSDRLKVGQSAVAIGNPYGFDHTVTAGLISALNRVLEKDDGSGIRMENLIQTDAPINPGNSGGALLAMSGEVIGINTAIISNAQNIGFAIPINTAKDVANEIIAYGRVKRPYTGVVEVIQITPSLSRWYNLPVSSGMYIASINKNSPAAKCGLVVDDIITKINGKEVATLGDLNGIFNNSKIGDQLKITVVNSNSNKTREVTLVVEVAP